MAHRYDDPYYDPRNDLSDDLNAGMGPYAEDEDEDDEPDDEDRDYPRGLSQFADPGGTSALRAASRSNPRNLPCPTCGVRNVLTPEDRARGYQCDACADRAEGRGY